MIQSLIDKLDTFEIVRDKVAQILADEVASQKALAVTAGKDPSLWDLLIFAERGNPWEQYLNDLTPDTLPPVVNVWFSNDAFAMPQGNVVEAQAAEGVLNIDCIGFGVSRADGAGHIAGDELAAREAHRALRLVRNILMASEYTYLGLRPAVARRWVGSRTTFQPPVSDQSAQKVIGARLELQVKYIETSPQYQGELMEILAIDIKRASTGQILAQLEYNYTP